MPRVCCWFLMAAGSLIRVHVWACVKPSVEHMQGSVECTEVIPLQSGLTCTPRVTKPVLDHNYASRGLIYLHFNIPPERFLRFSSYLYLNNSSYF